MRKKIWQQNDTGPPIEVTLYGSNRRPIDLTGKSVEFHMTPFDSETRKIDAAATVVNVNGRVQYWPTAADTDTIGLFRGSFRVWDDDSDISYPNDSYILIEITDDI
jgi:hypothetical protein